MNQSNAALGGVAAKQNQVVYQAAQIIQLEGLITHLNPQRNRLQGRIAGHQARLNVGRPQGRPPQESLNSRKRNTETRLKQLTKEITDDEAVLANSENKTKLEAIKAQRKKKTQTEAALRIIEERVGTKQPDGTYRLPDAEKLAADITRIKGQEAQYEVDDPVRKHKREALTVYKENILESSKLNAIRIRANEAIVDIYNGVANRNTPAGEVLIAAKDRMPWIPGAYLRTIQILGSDKALEHSVEGAKAYEDLSKLVTPGRFFQVMMQDNNRSGIILAAYNDYLSHLAPPQAHVAILPQSIFHETYTIPQVQQAMLRQVNEFFIRDLLKGLETDALTKKLGDPGSDVKSGDAQIDERNRMQREQLMRELAYEKEDHALTPEKHKEKLETKTEEAEERYTDALDARAFASVANVRILCAGYGISPEQMPVVVSSLHQVIVNNNLVDVISNDDLEPPFTDTRTQLGTDLDNVINRLNLARLTDTQRVTLVNQIRLNAIVSSDVAPYQEAVSAVEKAGIAPEKTAYVLNAGIRTPFDHDDLIDADGHLTTAGTRIQAELGKINQTLDNAQIVALVNDVDKLNVAVEGRDTVSLAPALNGIEKSKAQYVAIAARRVLERKGLLQNAVDAGVVTGDPDIFAQLTVELTQIGVDISPIGLNFNDDRVADLLESVREQNRSRRVEMKPQIALLTAVGKAGIEQSRTADVAVALEFALARAGVRGKVTTETYTANTALQTQVKDHLRTVVDNPADIDALTDDQLRELINSVAGEKYETALETSNTHAMAVEDIVRTYVKFAHDNPAVYHDVIQLAVAASSLDADSALAIQKAMNAMKREQNVTWDAHSVINHLPTSVRDFVLQNSIQVAADLQTRFNNIYNPVPPVGYQDIPVPILRRLADEALMARRGHFNPPYDRLDDRERVQFSALLNSAIDVEDHDIRLARYERQFFGSNEPHLLAYEIADSEGLSPEEALMYAKAVLAKRVPKVNSTRTAVSTNAATTARSESTSQSPTTTAAAEATSTGS